jgi:hypothetical protein
MIISTELVNKTLNDINSNAVDIHNTLESCFKNESESEEGWWEWTEETLKKILFNEYSVVINDACWEKILSIKFVCNSNSCFFDWFDFNQCALSFTGNSANFNSLKTASPGMIISFIKSLKEIRKDIFDENIENFKSDAHVFSNEVVSFICTVLISDGVYFPPPSIAHYITDEFSNSISNDTKKLWASILKLYSEFELENYKNDKEDDAACIQARRVLKAELAAKKY